MPTAATKSSPIITLTTDFGLSDHFVGVMKGVILNICPAVRIVDISHDVPAFDISQGAFLIAQAYRYFPSKTIHVVVVDPGVGTSRRPILVEAAGQYFIAPDNGVLAGVYSDQPHKVRAITAEKYFLQPPSQTFHGRDIFAPVAAHLARSVRPSSVGARIEDYLKLAYYKPQQTGRRIWSGTVLRIDRFGNLITNFLINEFEGVRTRPFELSIGPHKVHRLALNYADAKPGELFVIVGSSGYLEIAANQGSAERLTGCGAGAPCEIAVY